MMISGGGERKRRSSRDDDNLVLTTTTTTTTRQDLQPHLRHSLPLPRPAGLVVSRHQPRLLLHHQHLRELVFSFSFLLHIICSRIYYFLLSSLFLITPLLCFPLTFCYLTPNFTYFSSSFFQFLPSNFTRLFPLLFCFLISSFISLPLL